MQRGGSGCAATAVLMFVSLGCEITAAAESTEHSERGFYVGASASRVEQDAQGEGQTLVVVGRFGVLLLQPNQVEVDDTQAGWNVTLGYRANKFFSAELAYYDFGEASVVEYYSPNVVPLPAPLTVRSDIKAYGPGVSLLGTLPLTSSLDIFARGGALFLDQEIETRVSSPGRTHRTGEEIWMVGAGAQWSFTSRWAARLEYQLTDDIERSGSTLSREAGTTRIEQVSLSVLFDF